MKYGIFVFENEGHTLLFIEQTIHPSTTALCSVSRCKQTVPDHAIHSRDRTAPTIAFLPATRKRLFRYSNPIYLPRNEITPSARVYGSIEEGPVPHRHFWSQDGNPAVTGPFEKEEDFGTDIALRSRQLWADSGRHWWLSDSFARYLPSALEGHEPTFTHGDLSWGNILVRKVGYSP